jgi:hypothetical protein
VVHDNDSEETTVFAKTMMTKVCRTLVWTAGAALLTVAVPQPAAAQDDPNPGNITFTGAFDVPTLYYFRGIRQEVDPSLTMWPVGDLGIALGSGDGAIKSVGVNLGIWNSLHTGSSGDGDIHYEQDFYTTLSLGFGGGVSLGTTYTAYTSPNNLFGTVKELSFRVAKSHMLAPYGIVAFEFDDEDEPGGQADGGHHSGNYLELGIGPTFPLVADGPTLTIPVKLGMSLADYYELDGEDKKFGFFDIGALVTVPLAGIPSSFGSWNVHAGVDYLLLGDTTEAFNINSDGETKKNAVVALFGVGLSY